jgi:hypothetical protein
LADAHYSGEAVWTALERRKAIETLFHDAVRPSCIVLPVFKA